MKYQFSLTLWILVAHLTVMHAFAQQEPLWGLYWNNQSVINPSMSGFGFQNKGFVQYRLQWPSLASNINTVVAGYDMNLKKWNSGIGVNYMYDNIGAIENQTVQLNYNYQFNLNRNHFFSVGLGIAYKHMSVDFNRLLATEWPDPAIPTTQTSDYVFGINAGLAYRFKGLEAGINITNINQPYMEDIGFKFQQHSYLYARYEWEKNSKITVIPSFIVRYESNFISPELNMNIKYNSKFLFGGGYRFTNSIVLNAGYEFANKFSLIASYEYAHTQFNFGPSFEFALVYKLKQEE